MEQRVWIADADEWPTLESTKADADAAGATMVVHGIPPALADQITPGTVGLVIVTQPDPAPPADPAPDPLATLLAALADAQSLEEVREAAAAAAEVQP